MQKVPAEAVEGNDVMEQEEKHWTNDPALIERFVLRQVNPADRNELEDHLRICEVCKQAVRTEQILIAGIRHAGREQFKSQLRNRIAVSVSAETPWGHILSAAAIIVIITGIGIYNRWFELQEPSDENHVVILPQTDSESGKTGEDDISVREITRQEATAPAPSTAPSISKDEAQQHARGPVREPNKRSAEVKTANEGDGHGDPRVTSGAGLMKVQTQSEQAAPEAMDALATVAGEEAIWLEGTVLSEEGDAQSVREKSFAAKSGTKKDQPLAGGAELRQDGSGIFAVSQQLADLLPPAQRLQQRGTGKVMTKVERIGDTTQLTLYLDLPLDENELESIRTEMPDSNSLILYLPDQRIRYTLPAGWSSQLQYKQTR